jgi:hypothetical protein
MRLRLVLLSLVVSAGCGGDPEELSWSRCQGKCDLPEGVTELALGAPASGRLGGAGDTRHFAVQLAEADTLIAELRSKAMDYDLYVRKGAPPTLAVHDDWSHGATANETLIVEGAEPGTYFFMVRSYAGSGDFTLTALRASQIPDADGDGLSDSVELREGLDPKSAQLEGDAEAIPWSGYWWPYYDGGTSEAAAKYDAWVKATQGFDPGLATWEKAKHGNPAAEYWVGHCHAWSAAAILEQEPTAPVTRNGITFSVADQKALLTELHFADTVALSIGVSSAKSFFLTLVRWLGSQRKALVADVHPGGETWNHPLFRYRMKATVDPADPSKRHYVATLTFASDGVDGSFVGHLDLVKTYYFYLRFANGDIVEHGWEGPSADSSNRDRHPDFFWRPSQIRPAPGCPLEESLVREIVYGASS